MSQSPSAFRPIPSWSSVFIFPSTGEQNLSSFRMVGEVLICSASFCC
ncbi:uncharacterized protein J3R85_003645 [Psidium guajava]|nr:uncharacterized protein J3R85_003645 [Psidium guajava]